MMEPEIYSRGPMIIAGISGSGDETRQVWEAYMKLEKSSPLKNTADKAGYEVRLYPGGKGPGRVHVGMNVNSKKVPPEYRILSLPESLYAEFFIYPAKGYGSRNPDIEKWLSENDSKYRQRYLNNNSYAIELYDSRYKGDSNPESVVPILVPLLPVG